MGKMIKSPVSILVCLFFVFFLKFLLIDDNLKNQKDVVADNEVVTTDGTTAIAGEAAKNDKPAVIDTKKDEKDSKKTYNYAELLPPLESMLAEHSVGDAKAPLVIHVFSAYTCGHCASFFKKTIPHLLENEVKDGKVRIIFEEYPTNSFAVKASMVARCSKNPDFVKVEEKTYKYSDRLYNKGAFEQAMASDPDVMLDAEKVEACLNYSFYKDEFKKMVLKRSEQYKIEATPTLVYRKSIRTYQESGAVSYSRVKEVISLLMQNKTPEPL